MDVLKERCILQSLRKSFSSGLVGIPIGQTRMMPGYQVGKDSPVHSKFFDSEQRSRAGMIDFAGSAFDMRLWIVA